MKLALTRVRLETLKRLERFLIQGSGRMPHSLPRVCSDFVEHFLSVLRAVMSADIRSRDVSLHDHDAYLYEDEDGHIV